MEREGMEEYIWAVTCTEVFFWPCWLPRPQLAPPPGRMPPGGPSVIAPASTRRGIFARSIFTWDILAGRSGTLFQPSWVGAGRSLGGPRGACWLRRRSPRSSLRRPTGGPVWGRGELEVWRW